MGALFPGSISASERENLGDGVMMSRWKHHNILTFSATPVLRLVLTLRERLLGVNADADEDTDIEEGRV